MRKSDSRRRGRVRAWGHRSWRLLLATAPSALLLAAQNAAAQAPAAQQSNAQTPAAQTPAAQTPAAQTPAAQTPAAQTPAAQTPAAQTPTPRPAASPSLGSFNGGVRSFFMATTNQGELQDWWSLAAGGRLGYESPRFHGLAAGAQVYATSEVVGNAHTVDPTTGRPSRYEYGLYDVGSERRRELALVGQAYLDLTLPQHHLWFGRRTLKSPLLNPQDGRMIPTLVQGGWYENTMLPWLKVQAGVITHIAPRSASRFMTVEQSVGLYPAGRNGDGTPSDYAGHVRSPALLVGALEHRSERVEARLWEYAALGMFNTLYGEAAWKEQIATMPLKLSGQVIWQTRLADGGAPQASQRYFVDRNAWVYGARIEWKPAASWTVGTAYNRITKAGRFTFPREWGREPLYTFQKRERSEGSGDQHAAVVDVEKSFKLGAWGKLQSKIGHGVYVRPHPSEAALNKYALPSMYQLNWDSQYSASGVLEGLSVQFLMVYKVGLGDVRTNSAWVQNKIDMINWNFVVDYAF